MKNKKTVLIMVNHDVVIYNFRLELVEKLLEERFRVIVSSPYGERIDDLVKLGIEYIPAEIDRRGKNPLKDLKLLKYYRKIVKDIRPDVILTYTIKPNIYGAFAAGKYHIPCVSNVTGLGSSIESESILQTLTLGLYRRAFQYTDVVFLQNKDNMSFFQKKRIAVDKARLLPGSGVNLSRYCVRDMPQGDQIEFAFVGRVMKEKGIDEYLEAAAYIREHFPDTRFHIYGFCEENYQGILKDLEQKGIVIYHGMVKDIPAALEQCHCLILPSYHEGMSNSLLEAAACGRPVIASDIPGCRETFEEGNSGFGFEVKNAAALINAIEKFIELPFEKKQKMGLSGRRKIEREFDRKIVVDAYMKEIRRLASFNKN